MITHSEDGHDEHGLRFKLIEAFPFCPCPTGEDLQLLENVSGSFRPGVLTALMGASGAGKVRIMQGSGI